MMIQVLEKNGPELNLKCFNYGKGGNFQTNFKAPRKRSNPSHQQGINGRTTNLYNSLALN